MRKSAEMKAIQARNNFPYTRPLKSRGQDEMGGNKATGVWKTLIAIRETIREMDKNQGVHNSIPLRALKQPLPLDPLPLMNRLSPIWRRAGAST
jgi:hypothetical protein